MRKRISTFFLSSLILISMLLSSCAENLPQDIPKTYEAPSIYTFDVPYKKAWKETIRTLATDYRIQTLDKESGLIVTEYLTVNKQVLTMFETVLFGRTYKNSYSINIIPNTKNSTDISIQSNLQMEQFAVYNRERSVSWFEAYLRQDLFRKICSNLYQSEAECDALFPTYKNTNEIAEGLPESSDASDSSTMDASTSFAEEQPMLIEIQSLLKEQGYTINTVDGNYDKTTSLAIKEYQLDNDLDINGEPTEELLEVLKTTAN